MACHTPVVASAVGGIKEVVVDGETGYLVPLDLREGSFEPVDSGAFEKEFASKVNLLMTDQTLREEMAKKGRKRVEDHFSWEAIALRTRALYEMILAKRGDVKLGSKTVNRG